MKVEDQKVLLLKTIALLYRESTLTEKSDNSSEIAKKVNASVQTPTIMVGRSSEIDMVSGLKRILSSMCENSSNYEYSVDTLLTDIRQACSDDLPLVDNFERTLSKDMSESDAKLSVINLRDTINDYFKDREVMSLFNKSIVEYRDKDKIPDLKKWFAELVGNLEPYTITSEEKDPNVNAAIDFTNPGSVSSVVDSMLEMADDSALLVTGWQGLNAALDGGFRPGEQWVFGAMEHNWKTGTSLSIFRQIVQYNEAKTVHNHDRKPCLLRISLEDTAEMNMQFLFKSIYENENPGQLVTDQEFEPQYIKDYVTKFMNQNGWSVFMFEMNPSSMTYKDICNEVLKLEARGYEVRLCMLDYLMKITTVGCRQGAQGVDLLNLYEKIKAFMIQRKCTMITPHQLSSDTKAKVREGTDNFVKEMLRAGYYAGTKQLAQVIDGEIFMNIEYDKNGEAYMTFQRGKHRKIRQTPIEFLYFVLKFIKGGVILDDLGKPNTTRKKVGGPTMAEASESVFDDMII